MSDALRSDALRSDLGSTVRWLLEGVQALLPGLEQVGDEHARQVAGRLRDVVVRPLRRLMASAPAPDRGDRDHDAGPPVEPEPTTSGTVVEQAGGRLWQLARAGTPR
jgi:hypothetical protein